VCAVPFSVLRRIEITAPLSPEKRRAIAEQPYDSATRVFVQVRRRHWEREGLSGFATTDLPDEIWHPTFDQPGPRAVLVSYTSGAQARRVAALAATERVAWMGRRAARLHPGLREHFEGGASFCWDEDEWARGAYSILKPGQMFTLLPHVARSEGRLHFAGEHTSAWPGWMQGALASGLRAAREINESP
jgi:monoamine oxidase